MEFSKRYQNVAKETLAKIDFYRKLKDGNCFDFFYQSHLDLMEELIEDYLRVDEKYVKVIVSKDRKQLSEDSSILSYVTICKKPHWSHDGVMLTSSTNDATKFKPSSPDLKEILSILNKDGEKYETVLIDKRCLSSKRNEYWEDEAVRGDWDETHEIKRQ